MCVAIILIRLTENVDVENESREEKGHVTSFKPKNGRAEVHAKND
jgi:hypothetical protein